MTKTVNLDAGRGSEGTSSPVYTLGTDPDTLTMMGLYFLAWARKPIGSDREMTPAGIQTDVGQPELCHG